MADAPPSGITGHVMFYQQPEPLTFARHGRLGVKQLAKPYQFLVGSNLVPITANEFGAAASSYPLIFAGPEKAAMAVMGARVGENVFLSPSGEVDREVYLPMFARRYPFALANDSASDRLVVCIDRAAPMFVEGGDLPLFNGEEMSKYAQDAVAFCQQYESFRLASQMFVDRITEFNLWEAKSVTLTPPTEDGSPGTVMTIAEYFAVSEKGLAELDLEKLGVLRAEGWLGVIYAHLMSLMLWNKILNRTLSIAMAAAAAAQAARAPGAS